MRHCSGGQCYTNPTFNKRNLCAFALNALNSSSTFAMPVLPEVETTRRGIEPHVAGQQVTGIVVRDGRMRWPVAPQLQRELSGQTIHKVERRAKYPLLRADAGTLILHLGMSGNLRILPCDSPPGKHDHVDIVLGNG